MARERSGTSEFDSRNGDESGPLLDRRAYLKAAGIAASVMAGAGGGAAAAVDADVNVVEAGADDTGSTAINDVLDRVHGDGTTIYFPPGRYLLRSFRTGANDWTWVGEDATIVVPGSENRNYLFFEGDGWTVDGFTIDLTAPGAAPINFLRGNDWEFKNVVFEGQMGDPQYRSGSNLLYPNVDRSGSTGVIENVIAKDGSADPSESSNRGALWAGPSNDGHLVVRNSHFRHFANNTLYVANIPGPVTIDGCLIEDSNVGVRVGGNTTVRNTVFDQRGPVPRARWSGGRAARGIWINSNSYTPGDIRVEGCDFLMDGPQGTRAVFARNSLDGIEIRDCRIRQNSGFSGIEFDGGGSGHTVIENTSVVGDSTKPAVRLVDRDGARLRNLCVQKSGAGVELRSSSDVSVEDSNVNVSGSQFVGSTPSTRNVTANGSCPSPSADWDGSDADSGDDGVDEPDETSVRLEGTAEYRIEVSGDIRPADEIAAWVDEGEQYGDGQVDWWVSDSWTEWYFTGEIERFDLSGVDGLDVYLDGEVVDPDDLPPADSSDGGDGDALPPNRITVSGTGTPTEYTFTASGDVVENPDRGSLEAWDEIDGNTVTGWVTDPEHVDSYRFGGRLTDLEFLQGEATVVVNGVEVDPSDV